MKINGKIEEEYLLDELGGLTEENWQEHPWYVSLKSLTMEPPTLQQFRISLARHISSYFKQKQWEEDLRNLLPPPSQHVDEIAINISYLQEIILSMN